MSDEEKPPTETVTLHSAGSIPGIPGSHSPGTYSINWIERTLTPIVDQMEKVVAHTKKSGKSEEAPEESAAREET